MSEEQGGKSKALAWTGLTCIALTAFYFLSYPFIEDWLPPGMYEEYSKPWHIVVVRSKPLSNYRWWVRMKLGLESGSVF
jgi:hypothetical protein